jgi:transcriptional regulator with XRE-family HTH domain
MRRKHLTRLMAPARSTPTSSAPREGSPRSRPSRDGRDPWSAGAASRGPQIGPRLRALRIARNLTLEQVAQGAGLTKGFVSRVERDQASVSIPALQRICEVLQTPVAALFDSLPHAFVAADDAPVIEFGDARLRQLVLTPAGVTDLRVVKLLLSPGASASGELRIGGSGTTFIHVLRGKLALDLEGEQFELAPGDSLTFPGRTPHTYRNASGRERCEALLAVTPAVPGSQTSHQLSPGADLAGATPVTRQLPDPVQLERTVPRARG